ncbi:MAG: DUF1360 domain-containing protein [Thermoleophilaceae bacterium]
MKVEEVTERVPDHGRETDDSPTEPIDYWTLNATFGALLAALAVASRNHPERVRAALEPRELPILFAATFAVSKAIARERIGVWMREPFVEQEGAVRRPRGRRLRHAVGELMTCTRCAGVWGALGMVGLRVASPHAGRLATGVLATAAANDFLQAGFRMLAEGGGAARGRTAVSARGAAGTREP